MEQLVVTEEGHLDVKDNKTNPVVKAFAVFFSYLFHPVFVIAWVVLFLLYRNNTVFVGMEQDMRLTVFLRVFSTSIFLPLVTVLLLKGLGFIQSVQLRTQKDRIVPYVASITFFFWSYYVSKQLNDPLALRAFLLSAFIAASASLLINNYMKVSMHATGVGGMLALMLLLLFSNQLDDALPLLVAILITGITCTSRLLVSDHRPAEITVGLVAGALIQLVAWMIVY